MGVVLVFRPNGGGILAKLVGGCSMIPQQPAPDLIRNGYRFSEPGSSCDSPRRPMRRGLALLEFRYRNESNVWVEPVALTRLVFDEQMLGRLLAESLLVAFAHRGAAAAHALSNRPLVALEAFGQLVRGQVPMVLGEASSRQILLVNVVQFPNQSAVGIPNAQQVLDDDSSGRRVDRQLESVHRRRPRTGPIRLHLIDTRRYGVGMLAGASEGWHPALQDGHRRQR